jgi:hypothetical protein
MKRLNKASHHKDTGGVDVYMDWYKQNLKHCNKFQEKSPCITFDQMQWFPFNSLISRGFMQRKHEIYIPFQAFLVVTVQKFSLQLVILCEYCRLQSWNSINLQFLALICLMKPSRAANTETEIDNPLVMLSLFCLCLRIISVVLWMRPYVTALTVCGTQGISLCFNYISHRNMKGIIWLNV